MDIDKEWTMEIQDIQAYIQQMAIAAAASPHPRHLKEQILSKVFHQSLNDLTQLIEQSTSEQNGKADLCEKLTLFLKNYWEKYQNSPLAYTCIPNHPFTDLCIEIAVWIAENSPTPDLNPLECLMPGVYTDSLHSDYLDLVPPQKTDVRAWLKKIIRTHILGDNRNELIPIQVVMETPENTFGDFQSIKPYHDLLSTDAASYYLQSTAPEYHRITWHSTMTQAINDAKLAVDDLFQKESNFYTELCRFTRLLSFYDAHKGIGSVTDAASGAYSAIFNFKTYYDTLSPEEIGQIPEPLNNEINLLFTLSSDWIKNRNATENLETCIGTRRETIERAAEGHEELLSQIHTSKEYGEYWLINAQKQLRQSKDALKTTLDQNTYTDGADFIGITAELLQQLNIHFSINDEKDADIIRALSPAEIRTIFNAPENQMVLLNYLRKNYLRIEKLVMLFIELNPQQIKALLESMSETLIQHQFLSNDPKNLIALLISLTPEKCVTVLEAYGYSLNTRQPIEMLQFLSPEQITAIQNSVKNKFSNPTALSDAFCRWMPVIVDDIQEQLPALVNDFDDFNKICFALSTPQTAQQRRMFINALNKKLPDLFNNSLSDLHTIKNALSEEQYTLFFDAIKHKLLALTNDLNDICRVIYYLSSKELAILLVNLPSDQLMPLFEAIEDTSQSLAKAKQDTEEHPLYRHIEEFQKRGISNRMLEVSPNLDWIPSNKRLMYLTRKDNRGSIALEMALNDTIVLKKYLQSLPGEALIQAIYLSTNNGFLIDIARKYHKEAFDLMLQCVQEALNQKTISYHEIVTPVLLDALLSRELPENIPQILAQTDTEGRTVLEYIAKSVAALEVTLKHLPDLDCVPPDKRLAYLTKDALVSTILNEGRYDLVLLKKYLTSLTITELIQAIHYRPNSGQGLSLIDYENEGAQHLILDFIQDALAQGELSLHQLCDYPTLLDGILSREKSDNIPNRLSEENEEGQTLSAYITTKQPNALRVLLKFLPDISIIPLDKRLAYLMQQDSFTSRAALDDGLNDPILLEKYLKILTIDELMQAMHYKFNKRTTWIDRVEEGSHPYELVLNFIQDAVTQKKLSLHQLCDYPKLLEGVLTGEKSDNITMMFAEKNDKNQTLLEHIAENTALLRNILRLLPNLDPIPITKRFMYLTQQDAKGFTELDASLDNPVLLKKYLKSLSALELVQAMNLQNKDKCAYKTLKYDYKYSANVVLDLVQEALNQNRLSLHQIVASPHLIMDILARTRPEHLPNMIAQQNEEGQTVLQSMAKNSQILRIILLLLPDLDSIPITTRLSCLTQRNEYDRPIMLEDGVREHKVLEKYLKGLSFDELKNILDCPIKLDGTKSLLVVARLYFPDSYNIIFNLVQTAFVKCDISSNTSDQVQQHLRYLSTNFSASEVERILNQKDENGYTVIQRLIPYPLLIRPLLLSSPGLINAIPSEERFQCLTLEKHGKTIFEEESNHYKIEALKTHLQSLSGDQFLLALDYQGKSSLFSLLGSRGSPSFELVIGLTRELLDQKRLSLHQLIKYPMLLKRILSQEKPENIFEQLCQKDEEGVTVFGKMAQQNAPLLKIVLTLFPNLEHSILEHIPADKRLAYLTRRPAGSRSALEEALHTPSKLEEYLLLLPKEHLLQAVNYCKGIGSLKTSEALQSIPGKLRLPVVNQKDQEGNNWLFQSLDNPIETEAILATLDKKHRLSAMIQTDKNGESLLHRAFHHPETFKILLLSLPQKQRFAALNVANQSGQTVLQKMLEHTNIFRFIFDFLVQEKHTDLLKTTFESMSPAQLERALTKKDAHGHTIRDAMSQNPFLSAIILNAQKKHGSSMDMKKRLDDLKSTPIESTSEKQKQLKAELAGLKSAVENDGPADDAKPKRL